MERQEKNKMNGEKHELVIEAPSLFSLARPLHFEDDRDDDREKNFITLGALKNRVVFVLHTQRDFVTCIISIRKANEREKKIYIKRLKEIG